MIVDAVADVQVAVLERPNSCRSTTHPVVGMKYDLHVDQELVMRADRHTIATGHMHMRYP